MIRANNISFCYEGNKKILKNINIQIKEGEITTIIGPNGSGKSTLLSILCNLNKPKSGEIFLEGNNINKLSKKQIARKIATVYQHNSVPNDITVEKLISYGRLPHKGYFEVLNETDFKIINWTLLKSGLLEKKNNMVMSLSGGERQRTFIAMALAQRPNILFLDEPTTYLDIFHQIEILETIKELNKKSRLTVVMVLHDINQAIKYSHNIVVMKNGEIIRSGKTDEIIDENLIRSVYKVQGTLNKDKETHELYFIPKSLYK
ncbi:ABC transporter ATP-binding protein [Clostridium sardiniense]|uniref:ABC transporter ATP-binding protein n=1 Tax=Clostridium sardiniense TaxID=29369 RepID=UPI001956F22A|nr:ABC transporter ATP-binding protein [Clostridium sardiniense]MBM7834811.1 iron complex transport system ATP-binding protein [Clostridium sardiniense]